MLMIVQWLFNVIKVHMNAHMHAICHPRLKYIYLITKGQLSEPPIQPLSAIHIAKRKRNSRRNYTFWSGIIFVFHAFLLKLQGLNAIIEELNITLNIIGFLLLMKLFSWLNLRWPEIIRRY